MSGGVDSSVAAALLVEQGIDVVGVFMRNGVTGASGSRSCCSLSDARDARAVADRLGVPFYVHDLARPFARLIDAFVSDYAKGLTPNPCVVCNNDLKFGELDQLARDLGCVGVATGHYARLVDGVLHRAHDREKDQSYLLAGLDAGQRARARFPLGAMEKHEVRDHARRLGLGVADKPDSADICFVPGGDYRALVAERRGDLGAPGEVLDESGRAVARHAGVAAFTVGQRRGLGVALGRPAYVTAVDPARGTVHVGAREALRRPSCRVGELVWQDADACVEREVLVQLRHHHEPERAWVRPDDDGRCARVLFATPSEAVCPGQYAVFYDGARVLGAGRIQREDGP
ncbi:MAG: tRNA 2-thiouridine(34) synthase MnmA [Planctomycetes bacterium]|nr:tRNA 2-thiouridine(34) synthase MnmA [Planctomycetota bacterium]